MLVNEIMSNRIVSVGREDSVAKAAKQMSDHNIGCVPVEDNGKLLGMLTDRDIVLRCVALGHDPNSCKAVDIMTENAAYVAPTQQVFEAARVMAAEQIRRLAVLENGKLKGILSLADIARVSNDAEIANALTEISMPS